MSSKLGNEEVADLYQRTGDPDTGVTLLASNSWKRSDTMLQSWRIYILVLTG